MGIVILIVDDEPNIRTMLRFCLEGDGYEIVEAAGVNEAKARLAEREIDIAFVDLQLGDGSGLELLERCPSLTVVMMTAFATVESAVAAMRHGASEYLQKPFTARRVQELVTQLASERRTRRERLARAQRTASAVDRFEDDSLEAAERRHIAHVIASSATMEEAARTLGIDVVTLWRRRKKYHLG